ncbi:MAG: HDOD domain-containing protein [Candidatus Tectomicrobia bacterium]|uniref:HDOD domain-containing protein n=1 Tax=Tectimicrobiota bacterium TaxID=2528274 RepID=A0A932GPM3_UNCTE|nr:HDOD domain-containing protein [Candidatus Tectomicrobia bacterium]
MTSILIASNATDAEAIKKAIGETFTVQAIKSPSEFAGLVEKPDLILLDHTFTEHSGIDFLRDLSSKHNLPVLMLAPADDYKCAFEALQVGADNYLVKTSNYHQLLNFSIEETLKRFKQQKQMIETINALRKRVAELEKRLGIPDKKPALATTQKKERNTYEEIAFRLTTGEISIPSLPQISIKFREMVNRGASAQEITNLLKHDAAISSAIIKISNSAYYRGMSKNTTLEQAISRLGINVTKAQVELVASKALYVTDNAEYTQVVRNLWEHSLSCAYASQVLAEIVRLKNPEEAFTMGLLHDIGKLGLLKIISELESNRKLENKVQSKELVEMLDTYHCEFGTTLLKSWRFPDEYLQVTKYHGNLEEADPASKGLIIVHFANLLVKSMGYGQAKQAATDLENTASNRFLKLNSESIETAKKKVGELMAEWSNSLGGLS